MEDLFILCVFALIPCLLGTLLLRLSREGRQKSSGAVALIAGNALVLAFLLSLFLLCGELYYQFIYDETDGFALAKTTERWNERHVRLNASGYRDSVDYNRWAPERTRRVTFLGDSFTFGHGVADVEDRFPNQIRANQPGYQIHALAGLGWDTDDHLKQIAQAKSDGYQLDVVVLVYCLNDISDIVPEWQEVTRRIYANPKPSWLIENSFFLDALYQRFRASRDPDVANYYRFVLDDYEGPVWRRQAERLARLKTEAESTGGRLLVVTFPFIHAIGPDYPFQMAHRQLDAHWRSLDVPHLDLNEAFRGEPPKDLVVNPRDPHPNERAHRLAADAIESFIAVHMSAERK